jgi:DNA-binding response OmpR family regulator
LVETRETASQHNRLRPNSVLIVDDEEGIVDLLRGYLEAEGFDVNVARDGPSALQQAASVSPDVIVLDVMLPGVDGVEVCRRLRGFSEAYVLMLTARSEELDRIVGLSVGADDYVTKPFSPREVVARVKALLRRPRAGPLADDVPRPRSFGALTIDESKREAWRDGDSISLTAREFDLLAVLSQHPGRVFTRSQLLERIWGDEYYDDHVVDVHIANLRKKIEADQSHPRYVQTVRGVGYRFAGDVRAE